MSSILHLAAAQLRRHGKAQKPMPSTDNVAPSSSSAGLSHDHRDLRSCTHCDQGSQKTSELQQYVKCSKCLNEGSAGSNDSPDALTENTAARGEHDIRKIQIKEPYCEICDRYFSSDTSLYHHRTEAHPEAIPLDLCPICSIACTLSEHLIQAARHRYCQNSPRERFIIGHIWPRPCFLCDASLSSREAEAKHYRDIRKHIEISHRSQAESAADEWQRYCWPCDQYFTTETDLLEHLCECSSPLKYLTRIEGELLTATSMENPKPEHFPDVTDADAVLDPFVDGESDLEREEENDSLLDPFASTSSHESLHITAEGQISNSEPRSIEIDGSSSAERTARQVGQNGSLDGTTIESSRSPPPSRPLPPPPVVTDACFPLALNMLASQYNPIGLPDLPLTPHSSYIPSVPTAPNAPHSLRNGERIQEPTQNPIFVASLGSPPSPPMTTMTSAPTIPLSTRPDNDVLLRDPTQNKPIAISLTCPPSVDPLPANAATPPVILSTRPNDATGLQVPTLVGTSNLNAQSQVRPSIISSSTSTQRFDSSRQDEQGEIDVSPIEEDAPPSYQATILQSAPPPLFSQDLEPRFRRRLPSITPDIIPDPHSLSDPSRTRTVSRINVEDTVLSFSITRAISYECPLCFEIESDLSNIPCGHVFCTSCISDLLDTAPCCPLCRSPVASRADVRRVFLAS